MTGRQSGGGQRSRRVAVFGLVLAGLVIALPATAPKAVTSSKDELPADARYELVGLRSANARFFALSDGTQQAEIYAQPVNYKNADGTWVPIDPVLVPSERPGYAWTNRAGGLDLDLASSARSTGMVRVGRRNASVTFGLVGARSSAAIETARAAALYRDVQPGIDLLYESGLDGVKESIVLKDVPAGPVSFRFRLTLDNLTAELDEMGGVTLLDKDGTPALRIPHGSMTDSSFDPHAGEPAYSDAVAYALGSEDGAATLTVTPSLEWLQDPARIYPVTVDPQITNPTSGDTFVQSDITTEQSAATELKAGTFNGGATKARSLFKFITLAEDMAGKAALTSTFDVYETWSYSCSPRAINVYRIAEPWTATIVKWSSQPAVHTPKADQIDVAKGYNGGGCADGWISFDVSNLVRNWLTGTADNYGLELRADDEADSYGWKKFKSLETASNPHLTIAYDSYPDIPTGLIPEAGAEIRGDEQNLAGIYNDPDEGDSGQLYFVVYNSQGQIVDPAGVPTSASFTASGTPVPTGLNHGTSSVSLSLPAGSYTWKAYSTDGTVNSSMTQSVPFTVDSSVPTANPILVPGDATQDTALTFIQPLSNAFLRENLSTASSTELVLEMVTPDESQGVEVGDETGTATINVALDEFESEYGVAPITALRIRGVDGVPYTIPATIAAFVLPAQTDTAAPESVPSQDEPPDGSDPTVYRTGYGAWVPKRGQFNAWSQSGRAHFFMTFVASGGSNFRGDTAYEHDLKLYDPNNLCIFSAAEAHFWAKRRSISYSTNMPSAYLDTDASDDKCHWRDFTIGSYRPQRFVNDRTYWIHVTAPRDTESSSRYQLVAQQLERRCTSSPWCVGLPFGYSASWLFIGNRYSVPGCRYWYRNDNSRPC